MTCSRIPARDRSRREHQRRKSRQLEPRRALLGWARRGPAADASRRAAAGSRIDPRGLLVEMVLVVAAVLVYFGVRGLTEGQQATATAHGRDLLAFERVVGLDVEVTMQSWIVDDQLLVTIANWVYIWGHWPVIAAVLLWLYGTKPHDYRLLRNAMFISGAVGVVIFITYPVAPPRLLGAPFIDTITQHSESYRVLQPPGLVNKFAAMPSLHAGWNLLIGISVWRATQHHLLRACAAVSPVAMAAAVVLTANHYVIDAIVGFAVALAGFAGSWMLTRTQTTTNNASERAR